MIREAGEADAEAIVALYNHYIANTVITLEEDELDVTAMRERIRKVQRSGYSWLVAIHGDEMIGYAYSSSWHARSGFRHTAEVSVYLSPAVRSKGWGTKLYEVLFAGLRQKGVHIVIGGITLPNPASIGIHEKFGLKQVAHFQEVGFKFGEWLDVGYWQVKLNG